MPNEMIELTIDGQLVQAAAGTSVLEAARQTGIEIPSLCYLKDINEIGVCRVCLVEVAGMKCLQAACVYPVAPGLQVKTNSQRVRKARRAAVELILSNHRRECSTCVRNLNCELQNLADNLGIRHVQYQGEPPNYGCHADNPAIQRDYDKCIGCRRCQSICSQIQGVNVYSPQGRGLDTMIAPAFKRDLSQIACTFCGQCVLACPTGSLIEKEHINEVWAAIDDPTKHVVVQTAPSIQVTLGEAFGLPVGTVVTGKLVSALRRLGFDRVFATDFTADLTIMEEAHELMTRLQDGQRLPLLSSCCPAWVKFCEHFYPQLLGNLSSCKSPHEMFGALAKTYYADREGLDPKDIIVVAVMPCTAKKFEANRPELSEHGFKDVDYVLTTRELSRMIRQAGINFGNLPDDKFDQPMGASSGAATIFGATGGVIEAAVRTAYAVTHPGSQLELIEFKAVRGQRSGIKEAEVELGGRIIKIAVVHGLSNAKEIMDQVIAGEHYDFIELMACPGGCVGGGGQPILGGRDQKQISLAYRHNRAGALYDIDSVKTCRKSHENEAIWTLYADYLGFPLSDRAKSLLHTHYQPRQAVNNQ